jgi:hypothetical protein
MVEVLGIDVVTLGEGIDSKETAIIYLIKTS